MLLALTVPTASVLFFTFVTLISLRFEREKRPFPPRNLLQSPSVVLSTKISFFVYLWVGVTIAIYTILSLFSGAIYSNLVRGYGLFSLLLIFLVLIPGIVHAYFPLLVFNGLFLKSRRSIGLSAFFISLDHAIFAFFYNYHASVFYILKLPPNYLLAVFCAISALLILSFMAFVDFRFIERRIGARGWKSIHRLLYLAAILIIFHAYLRGFNFQDQKQLLPLIVNYLTLSLILLEIGATVKRIIKLRELNKTPQRLLVYSIFTTLAGVAIYVSFALVYF